MSPDQDRLAAMDQQLAFEEMFGHLCSLPRRASLASQQLLQTMLQFLSAFVDGLSYVAGLGHAAVLSALTLLAPHWENDQTELV